jgi:DNA-binding PadR family transcriptional regulator
MYRDNTLIPSEAVRLLALGMLASRPMSYAELAREVRHFTGRVVGPSLDLVGAPLEVLKVEGLVENLNPTSADSDDPEEDGGELTVTAEGRAELRRLLAPTCAPR